MHLFRRRGAIRNSSRPRAGSPASLDENVRKSHISSIRHQDLNWRYTPDEIKSRIFNDSIQDNTKPHRLKPGYRIKIRLKNLDETQTQRLGSLLVDNEAWIIEVPSSHIDIVGNKIFIHLGPLNARNELSQYFELSFYDTYEIQSFKLKGRRLPDYDRLVVTSLPINVVMKTEDESSRTQAVDAESSATHLANQQRHSTFSRQRRRRRQRPPQSPLPSASSAVDTPSDLPAAAPAAPAPIPAPVDFLPVDTSQYWWSNIADQLQEPVPRNRRDRRQLLEILISEYCRLHPGISVKRVRQVFKPALHLIALLRQSVIEINGNKSIPKNILNQIGRDRHIQRMLWVTPLYLAGQITNIFCDEVQIQTYLRELSLIDRMNLQEGLIKLGADPYYLSFTSGNDLSRCLDEYDNIDQLFEKGPIKIASAIYNLKTRNYINAINQYAALLLNGILDYSRDREKIQIITFLLPSLFEGIQDNQEAVEAFAELFSEHISEYYPESSSERRSLIRALNMLKQNLEESGLTGNIFHSRVQAKLQQLSS